MAPPGGICVSDNAYQQVKTAVDVEFDDLGQVAIKNSPEPVHAWSISIGPGELEKRMNDSPTIVARRLASVVVLPFSNMSADHDQEYFADGITEDLITSLSHFRELAVVSRNSAYAFKHSPMDIRQIARELDATHVIEGSVRKQATAFASPPS